MSKLSCSTLVSIDKNKANKALWLISTYYYHYPFTAIIRAFFLSDRIS